MRVNGAAARRPRKAGGRRPRPAPGVPASMGPRPDGRGKLSLMPGVRGTPPASMGPRPDGRGKGQARIGQGPASLASMGPRPDGRGKYTNQLTVIIVYLRQWGRGQTAAESIGAVSHPRRPGGRQWGRGQTAAESAGRSFRRTAAARVNGAAARRPRKVTTRVLPASVSGRQWGRGQTAAERSQDPDL